MRVLGRALLVGIVGILFVMALNITAQGVASLTLQEQGPVLACCLSRDGDVQLTWLGQTHLIKLDKLRAPGAKLVASVTGTVRKVQEEMLPRLKARLKSLYFQPVSLIPPLSFFPIPKYP